MIPVVVPVCWRTRENTRTGLLRRAEADGRARQARRRGSQLHPLPARFVAAFKATPYVLYNFLMYADGSFNKLN